MNKKIVTKKAKSGVKFDTVKEEQMSYSIPTGLPKYQEEIYSKIKNQDLILFGIHSILQNNETCTFERLVAECFTMFPKVFGFMRYPHWPDSLKFDRVLRTLREKGLIIGGAGGRYSPGDISLTEFGKKIAKKVEDTLAGRTIVACNKKIESSPRSIDEKALQYILNDPLFEKYLNSPDNFAITELELRRLLRCTLETPVRIIKQNLEYFKNLAKSYNNYKLLEFLSLCEDRLLKKGGDDG